MDRDFFDQLGQRIEGLFPGDVGKMRGEVNRNITTLLRSAFAELDLVSREEFEVQREVLGRTRSRLEALETRVAALEVERR